MISKTLLMVLAVLVANLQCSAGHGYLIDPPARSSMWRENFNTPHNYNDNQLNCGGYYNQWSRNRGKCGICGDPFEQPQPRDNESGGKYGKGIIVRTYSQGQEVTFKVMITANHFGWFEFRLCPDGSPTTPVTEACLERYLLQLADGSGTRFNLGSARNVVSVRLRLPAGVTCTQCVLQWKWHAGNNNGVNPDMTSCLGCGPQEEFYGCADIAITGSGNNASPTFPNAPVTNPATFVPVQFNTFPTVPNVQSITTPVPTTPQPYPVTAKPTGSGGFMPITLPTRGPQTISSAFTTNNKILPGSFKPITPLPPISPAITLRPQTSVAVTQSTAPPVQTSRPTGVILPSSFRPITPRYTLPPITPRPQAAVTVTQTTRAPLPIQTPRPTINILPSSFKPINPSSSPKMPTVPITLRPQPTTIVPQTTQTTQSQTSGPNLPVSFQPISPRLTAAPITFNPLSTVRMPRTTQPPMTRPTTSLPTRFQPITPHPTAPLTTQASTTVTRPPVTPAPFLPVTANGPFIPLTNTPTQLVTNPTNPTTKSTTRPLVVTFFRPSPTTATLPTTTRKTTPPNTVKPIIFTLGSTTSKPLTTPRPQQGRASTVAPPPSLIQGKTCHAINSWAGDKQLDQWCHAQCNTLGGTCPPEFCECV